MWKVAIGKSCSLMKKFSLFKKYLTSKMAGCMPIALKKPLRKVLEWKECTTQLMWWFGEGGHQALFFCEQWEILETIVKPINNTLFAGRHWILQQDSAPAHEAKTTQWWLETNFPEFIATEHWPSGSPDLNPLDYHLWNILEEKACCMPHHNIETLKTDLVKSSASIPLDVVHAVIGEWPGHLRNCEGKG